MDSTSNLAMNVNGSSTDILRLKYGMFQYEPTKRSSEAESSKTIKRYTKEIDRPNIKREKSNFMVSENALPLECS